jgi:hypothetical protein
MPSTDLAFQFAKEVSTQLITIASALIGISVTFIKDFRADAVGWLRASWLFYIASILLGILAMMALTGTLESLAASKNEFKAFTNGTRWAAGGQMWMAT